MILAHCSEARKFIDWDRAALFFRRRKVLLRLFKNNFNLPSCKILQLSPLPVLGFHGSVIL
jgi:hypothetical protein